MASLSCKLPEKDKIIVLLINAIQGHNKIILHHYKNNTVNSRPLALWTLRYNRHSDNIDAARSQAKINCRCLTEINSCNYGHSLMRTSTRGPHRVHYKGSCLYLEIIKKKQPMAFHTHKYSSSFNVKLYNRAVTMISSCQVYEISRKELNSWRVLLFLFPFVSHEST